MKKIFTLVLMASFCIFCNSTEAQTISVIGHSSNYANQAGVYEITIPCPANYQQDDLLLAHIATSRSTSGSILPPAGWVKIRGIINAPYQAGIFSFYKIAGASEPTSYTFSDSLANGSISKRIGAITIYRGVDPLSPINIEDGKTQSGGAAAVNTPSVTTTVNSCMLVTLFSASTNSATWTPPSGTIEQYDTASSNGPFSIMSASSIQATAGSVQMTAISTYNANVFSAEIIALQPPTSSSIESNTISKNDLNIYPNPANGVFTLVYENNMDFDSIEIYNMLGEIIYKTKLDSERTTLNLNDHLPSIYLYKVLNEKNETAKTGKIIIQ